MELANEGKTKRFLFEGDLLFTQGHSLCVPQHGSLHMEIMKEYHDSRWVDHPGMHRMMALLVDHYYRPHMGDAMKTFVKTCLVCRQDKDELKTSGGLLQPKTYS